MSDTQLIRVDSAMLETMRRWWTLVYRRPLTLEVSRINDSTILISCYAANIFSAQLDRIDSLQLRG